MGIEPKRRQVKLSDTYGTDGAKDGLRVIGL